MNRPRPHVCAVGQIPGVDEKPAEVIPRCPYPKPTQVPWVESPRRWDNRGQGNRQISPVCSLEGVPGPVCSHAGSGRRDQGDSTV